MKTTVSELNPTHMKLIAWRIWLFKMTFKIIYHFQHLNILNGGYVCLLVKRPKCSYCLWQYSGRDLRSVCGALFYIVKICMSDQPLKNAAAIFIQLPWFILVDPAGLPGGLQKVRWQGFKHF